MASISAVIASAEACETVLRSDAPEPTPLQSQPCHHALTYTAAAAAASTSTAHTDVISSEISIPDGCTSCESVDACKSHKQPKHVYMLSRSASPKLTRSRAPLFRSRVQQRSSILPISFLKSQSLEASPTCIVPAVQQSSCRTAESFLLEPCPPPSDTVSSLATSAFSVPDGYARWRPRRPKKSNLRPTTKRDPSLSDTHVDPNLSRRLDLDSFHTCDAMVAHAGHTESNSTPTSTQDCAENLLIQLSVHILRHTLLFICREEDTAIVNSTFSALRLVSKALCATSDSSRSTIILHPCHGSIATSMLAKLSDLTSVTLCALHPAETSKFNLSLISSTVRNLTSLSLRSVCDVSMDVWEFEQALLPWRYSLTRLELHRCVLMAGSSIGASCCDLIPDPETSYMYAPTATGMGSTDVTDPIQSWAPDLPLLTSFNMSYGSLQTLDLRLCGKLTDLHVWFDDCLETLAVSGMTCLRDVSFRKCASLTALDLSGCVCLEDCYVTLNHQLILLNLSGCSTLCRLTCCSNESLASIDLSQCGRLQTFMCQKQASLEILDLSSCSDLKNFHCRDNPFLAQLNLQGNTKLEKFICSNSELTVLDLSTCKALRILRLSFHCRLPTLDVSMHMALQDLYIHGNAGLGLVDVSGCCMLQGLICTCNHMLQNVDASGCESLCSLVCRENSKLLNLDIAECKALKVLDVKFSKKLLSFRYYEYCWT